MLPAIKLFIKAALLSVCLLFIVQKSQAQTKDLTIKGNIKLTKQNDAEMDECFFWYVDILSAKPVIIPIRRDTLGNYKVSVPIESYQQFFFGKAMNNKGQVYYSTGMRWFSFFGKPGQTMTIDYKQEKHPFDLKFAGDFAKENQQYEDYDNALSGGTKNLYELSQNRKLTPAEVKEMALSSFKEKMSFNKKYFAKHPAPEFVKQQAYYDALYKTQSAAIEINNNSQNKVTEAMVADFYRSMMNTGRTYKDGPGKLISFNTDPNPSLKNAGAVGNDEYIDMLDSYYRMLDRAIEYDKTPTITYKALAAFALKRYKDISEQDRAVLNKILDDKEKLTADEEARRDKMERLYHRDFFIAAEDRKQLQSFLNIKDPVLRDIAATMMLSRRLSVDKLNTIEPLLDMYKAKVTNPYLKNKFLTAYNRELDILLASKIPAGAILNPADGFKGNDVLAQILQKYKGKVVYLDVWATWCVPCIAAMPASEKLRDKFKGQDVVFLYLCINSPEQIGWKNLISTKNIEGQHYFLDPTQSSAVGRALNIAFIPRYTLIDKEGNIVEKETTSPYDANTVNKISELIKK
ncbi:TlpA family protein disulfide reductase [Mucilaginibacter myungsuensis]|uniref:Redoxin family protein n=1 Tax=Mucilaginibacter myungsuensis TaxID=649104 RepID=A0A929PY03_9SPHI|nr:TlpA disulfide reductase family protein [Mucilaginibacter myungsuensis]MBE9663679.1 redoxin family protein [Mucilaginibacter myungsuensis]MDN3598997.1 TlpA disulfide reductase family protein [Mucilaginibacter myungsuensis]